MNIKDKLLKYRHKEQPVPERYMNFIKETIDNTNLTEEQYNFIKDLYLQDGKVLGLHNTYNKKVDLYFTNGLYNCDRLGNKNTSITNTVMISTLFTGLLCYFNPDTTIILSFPEDILKAEKGVFEPLNNNIFGIPSSYIVGAFIGTKLIKNPNYNPSYENESAIKIDDPISNFHSQKEKIREVNLCSSLFYLKKDTEINNISINKRY